MKNKNMVPAVDKALAIVEYMCSMERPVTQAEICKGVDVSATTGYRIVQSLMKHNWIRRNRNNTYSLSIGMISVLMRSQKNGFLFDAAQTVLDALAEETKLTCKLSIRQWNEQVAVLRADSPEPFAVGGKNGVRFDAYHCQDVLVLEEFHSQIPISAMLNYLDIYPLTLPARYTDRIACYTKVYITSNIPLEEQYRDIQRYQMETWRAFLRRVQNVIEYLPDGSTVQHKKGGFPCDTK